MKSYPLYQAYRAVLAFFTDWQSPLQPTLLLSPNPLPLNGILRIDVLNVGRCSVSIEVLTKENKHVLSRLLVPATPDYVTAFRLPAGLKPGMYQVVVKVFGRHDVRVWLALEEADLPVGVAALPPAASSWLKRLWHRLASPSGRPQLPPALALALSGALFVPVASGWAQSLNEASVSVASSEAVGRPAPTSPVIVSGRVVDERGRPLAGATVDVPSSRVPCSTNATGNFLLTAYPKGTEQLFISFSYLGYLDVTRPVSATFLNVAMEPAPGAKKYRANAKVRRYRRHLKPE